MLPVAFNFYKKKSVHKKKKRASSLPVAFNFKRLRPLPVRVQALSIWYICRKKECVRIYVLCIYVVMYMSVVYKVSTRPKRTRVSIFADKS